MKLYDVDGDHEFEFFDDNYITVSLSLSISSEGIYATDKVSVCNFFPFLDKDHILPTLYNIGDMFFTGIGLEEFTPGIDKKYDRLYLFIQIHCNGKYHSHTFTKQCINKSFIMETLQMWGSELDDERDDIIKGIKETFELN